MYGCKIQIIWCILGRETHPQVEICEHRQCTCTMVIIKRWENAEYIIASATTDGRRSCPLVAATAIQLLIDGYKSVCSGGNPPLLSTNFTFLRGCSTAKISP